MFLWHFYNTYVFSVFLDGNGFDCCIKIYANIILCQSVNYIYQSSIFMILKFGGTIPENKFWGVTILSATYCNPIECQWCTTRTYKCFSGKSSSADIVYTYFLTVIISIGFWIGCYHFRCFWEWSFKCNVYSLFFFGCCSKDSSTGICTVTI